MTSPLPGERCSAASARTARAPFPIGGDLVLILPNGAPLFPLTVAVFTIITAAFRPAAATDVTSDTAAS